MLKKFLIILVGLPIWVLIAFVVFNYIAMSNYKFEAHKKLERDVSRQYCWVVPPLSHEVIEDAEKASLYKIERSQVTTEDQYTFAYDLKSVGIPLTTDELEKLKELFLNPESFYPEYEELKDDIKKTGFFRRRSPPEKICGFDPGTLLRFEGKNPVDVLICSSCLIWKIHYRGRDYPRDNFDHLEGEVKGILGHYLQGYRSWDKASDE